MINRLAKEKGAEPRPKTPANTFKKIDFDL